MAVAVLLPALSPTMKEGRITKWLKKEGDTIASGMAIAELETDKSNLEVEAYDDGILLKIVIGEGETGQIGAPIAYIGKAGEKVDVAAPAPAAAPPLPVAAKPAATPAPSPQAAPLPGGATQAATAAPSQSVVSGGRIKASPLAKSIARAEGLDLSTLSGSGPGGRIIKRDVEGLRQGPRTLGRSARRARREPERVALSQMRKVIAQRLGEVKPGVPHFYLTVDIEMDAAVSMREEALALGLKVSVNDLIVKAAGLGLVKFPAINKVFAGDHILQLHTADVGVAVAIDEGLVTPIVRDADQKSLGELSVEVKALAERARKKSLRPEEYSGGSITVSNLGMFGIDSFIAVINPPQAAILAVGRVEPKAVVRDGALAIRKMMSVTLSGDHRVIDGALGAQYLKELRGALERPLQLFL